MSKEALLKRLEYLADFLEITPPIYNNNNSFSLSLNNQQEIHFRLENQVLVVYTNVVDKLPSKPSAQQQLFHRLREAAKTWSRRDIGSLVIDDTGIFFARRLSFEEADEIFLAIFLPNFIELAVHWFCLAHQSMYAEKILATQDKKISIALAEELNPGL